MTETTQQEGRVTGLVVLTILAAAALLNMAFVPLAGRNARPEHIAAALAFAIFAIPRLLRRQALFTVDAYSLLAFAWAATNALSSWLFAPQPSESLVHAGRLGLLALTFVVVANIGPAEPGTWFKRAQLWLVLSSLEIGYGAVAWGLARFGDVWLPGLHYSHAISALSVQGTQLERNLYGILAASLVAFAGYLALANRRLRSPQVMRSRILFAIVVLAATGVALSLTRSAWFAVALTAPLAYVFLERRAPAIADRPLLQSVVVLPLAVAACIGLASMLPPLPTSGPEAERWLRRAPTTGVDAYSVPRDGRNPARRGISGRLRTLGQLDSDFTVSTRMQDAKWAFADWLRRPVLGHGTGSFAQIHGTRVGTEAWISNLILHTLVDTGVVGLVIQLSLFGLVVVNAWTTARVTRHPETAMGLRAMTLATIVMLVAYQLTDGTWLALFWIHLGLMVNGIYSVRRETRMISDVTHA